MPQNSLIKVSFHIGRQRQRFEPCLRNYLVLLPCCLWFFGSEIFVFSLALKLASV